MCILRQKENDLRFVFKEGPQEIRLLDGYFSLVRCLPSSSGEQEGRTDGRPDAGEGDSNGNGGSRGHIALSNTSQEGDKRGGGGGREPEGSGPEIPPRVAEGNLVGEYGEG